MFFRKKRAGGIEYIQLVESHREGGKPRQRVVSTLGRTDDLATSGKLDSLLLSGAKFSTQCLILSAHQRGEVPSVDGGIIGPALVFDRLWSETGCRGVIEGLLEGRRFDFPVERAIFLEVLHRLVVSGSDRSGYHWKEGLRIGGTEGLQLHHAYRAMGFLGKELPPEGQEGRTPFSPRCTKDLIEEALFSRRKHLFTSLSLVFFDTTSIYFEGEGGRSLGERGFSKDHRPDLKQMIAGLVMDSEGNPICCEMWPGSTTDVKTLVPVVNRMRSRFDVGSVCIVADRGMISKETLAAIEGMEPPVFYILGARLRAVKEIRQDVLSRAGCYTEVRPPGGKLAPLKVKGVRVPPRRYVICLNEAEAQKDRMQREAILKSLEAALRSGDKSLVGNKGYRKYIKVRGESHFEIDLAKAQDERRFDGKYVLQTNTDLAPAEVALQYKVLWRVERIFRDMMSLLETRPVYHHLNETIRGHVFCSFLALLLRKELEDRLRKRKVPFEWDRVIMDLTDLTETEIVHQGKRFVLRKETKGACGKVFQAAGVALPPTIRQIAEDSPPER